MDSKIQESSIQGKYNASHKYEPWILDYIKNKIV